MKKCNYCGAENLDDALFCSECGATIEEAAAAEDVTETAEDAADVAEETANEVVEEAETVAEEAAEVTEDTAAELIAAAEATEENVEEASEITEEAAEEVSTKPAKKAKRGGWTWVTTLVIVITAVVVAALLGFLELETGFASKWAKNVWEKVRPRTKNSCVIEDYSVIEIPETVVATVDDEVETYISSLLSGAELTDEWVQAYSAVDSQTDAQTVEEFRQYIHDYIYDYYVEEAVLEKLTEMTTVKSYDEEQLPLLKDYTLASLSSYAVSYGMDSETLAKYAGYESADAYAEENAKSSLTTVMIFDQIIKDKKITYTQEDVDKALQDYLNDYGYNETYTLDSFKEEVGEAWLFVFENLQVKSKLVMDAIRDNVVLVPAE